LVVIENGSYRKLYMSQFTDEVVGEWSSNYSLGIWSGFSMFSPRK
jgi:hypothetical protein